MYSKAYKCKKVKRTNNLGQREYLLFRAGHMILFAGAATLVRHERLNRQHV